MSETIPGGYYLDSNGNPKDAEGRPVAPRQSGPKPQGRALKYPAGEPSAKPSSRTAH